VSRDLETFAKHGGRSTVNADDVMLLARRNEGLEELLRAFVENLRVKEGTVGGQSKRGGGASVGGGSGAKRGKSKR
jgi:centromere protein S